jgi:hypothetical protein
MVILEEKDRVNEALDDLVEEAAGRSAARVS